MDQATRQAIIGMARVGCLDTTIMKALGFDRSAWADLLRSNPDIQTAIDSGRGQGSATVLSAVFEKAIAGDVNAAKYILGLQDTGYRTDQNTSTSIQVQMPSQREIYAILKSDPAMLEEATPCETEPTSTEK